MPVVAHYALDDADAAKQAKKVVAGKPEAIVVIGVLDDAAPVVRALIDAGANPKELPIYGTDGLYSSRFAELVNPQNPGVVEGIKGTAPASAPAGVTSPFQATFGLTGIDPVFSAHYYDCTILTALAAEKAKSDSPAKMAKAFAANLKGSNGCNTFAECRDLLAAGKTIHWRGASSSFDRFGKFEPDEGVYELWSYDADGTPQAGDPAAQLRVTRPRVLTNPVLEPGTGSPPARGWNTASSQGMVTRTTSASRVTPRSRSGALRVAPEHPAPQVARV